MRPWRRQPWVGKWGLRLTGQPESSAAPRGGGDSTRRFWPRCSSGASIRDKGTQLRTYRGPGAPLGAPPVDGYFFFAAFFLRSAQ